jgi:hypothetical protein
MRQDGTFSDGTISDGTVRDGTARDETAQDGTVRDGSSGNRTAPIRSAPGVRNRTAAIADRDFRNDRFAAQPQLRVDRQRFPMETTMSQILRTPAARQAPAPFELLFVSLFDDGRGYAFPCDAAGQVDLDALSDRLRLNYLYVRKLIGRDFSAPAVRPTLQ